MNKKVLLLTICYIIGNMWGLYFNRNITLIFSCVGIIIFFCMKNKKLALVLGLIMATAFIKARTQSIQFDKLYSIESDIVVVGEIVEIHDEGRFILKIKTINDNKVTNNRKLQVYAKNQVAAVGETVIINGEYSTGSYARNEGVFNYKQYMQSKGIVR